MRIYLPPPFAVVAVGAVLLAVAALTLYIPADWVADLGPPPDALEYAVTGKSIAHGGPYSISLLGHLYPPRYPFGFPVLIAPMYVLPGATLANGIYGVGLFGVLTVVLVYRLTVLLDGQFAGMMAGAILLLLPQYLSWNHQVMSETASAALTVIAALLLYRIADGDDGRRRRIRLTLLGLICGLAILVHITNVALLLASFAVLLLIPSIRKRAGRPLLALAAGPLIAVVILCGYNWMTFGRFTGTGYAYWAPEWYGTLGK